jgi:hypothetical protein
MDMQAPEVQQFVDLLKQMPGHECHLTVLNIYADRGFIWTHDMLAQLDKLAWQCVVEAKSQTAQKQSAKEHHDKTNQSAHQDI